MGVDAPGSTNTRYGGEAGRPGSARRATLAVVFGGTWPAAIWHTYGENMFVPLGFEQFTAPTFTGSVWNQVPPYLRKVPKKHTRHNHNNWNNGGNGGNGGNGNGP